MSCRVCFFTAEVFFCWASMWTYVEILILVVSYEDQGFASMGWMKILTTTNIYTPCVNDHNSPAEHICLCQQLTPNDTQTVFKVATGPWDDSKMMVDKVCGLSLKSNYQTVFWQQVCLRESVSMSCHLPVIYYHPCPDQHTDSMVWWSGSCLSDQNQPDRHKTRKISDNQWLQNEYVFQDGNFE